jgi:3,4-dihydroxy 2-butanone 4-phosphate synthase/GTP cyclohydrolase II
MIAAEGRGMLLYLPQEGRGIGLAGKLQAYTLQEQGYDTVDANEQLGYPVDARAYTSAIEILHECGITHARLLTNNPAKIQALTEAENIRYLQTKHTRLGHLLTSLSQEERAPRPLEASSTPRKETADDTDPCTATSA